MPRVLFAFFAALVLAACGHSEPEPLANYQFNIPVTQVAAKLVELTDAHSSLSRIAMRRPPLDVRSTLSNGTGLVTIAVPGGGGKRAVTLTFTLTPYLDGKYTMAALSMDAPDAEEIDLGANRYAGAKSLGKAFGEALGTLANKVNAPYYQNDPARRFGRLFDLAAALDDPALRARVISRGKQEGSVDFLFFDVQPEGVVDDSAS